MRIIDDKIVFEFYNRISPKLINRIDLYIAKPRMRHKILYKYIKSNLFKIICGTTIDLENIVQDLETGNSTNTINYLPQLSKFNSTKNSYESTSLGKEILKLFNYKSFRSSVNANWLAQQLNAKTCLYCNTQYTLSLNWNKRKTLLFQYDHFYPTSIYPFFSLSIYNLIPSCSNCNQSKSNLDTKNISFFQPYLETINDIINFELDRNELVKYCLTGYRNESFIKILLKDKQEVENDKFTRYINTFQIEDQTSHFKDIIQELVLKSKYYNSNRRNELINLKYDNVSLFQDKSILDRFILGNYCLDRDLDKRPLSKLMKDIGLQLNLI